MTTGSKRGSLIVLPFALLLAGCTAGDVDRSPTPTERVGSAGVTVGLPAGWSTAPPQDGNVTDPVTRLVVSSAPLGIGTTPCQIGGYGMADDAVTLVVVEWAGDPGPRLPPRPARFTSSWLPVQPPPALECFDGPGGSVQFVQRGRSFGAYLLLGERAPPSLVDEARTVLDTLRVEARRLAHSGIAVIVPDEWDGRILYADPAGAAGAILQVANFRLPPNEGFEPPLELPPGQEDPIKAMGEADVLVTIDGYEATGIRPPEAIGVDDLRLLPPGAPRVPRGHALAQGSFCYRARCVRIEVDFGGVAPPADLREDVDRVLASLTVR